LYLEEKYIMSETRKVRVAALADCHYTRASAGHLKDLFVRASETADVLAVCGDMTDYGLPEEAAILAQDIKAYVRIPCVGVVGNHDFESGKIREVQSILEEAGVHFLDGEAIEILGAGFAGVCGFGGGFDRQMLNPWGEPMTKAFVQEALDHSLRLEKALNRLTMDRRAVLLHYSPIRETVQGENPEIFPFLGSSRLENPINQFNVSVVFHGHAHNGKPAGKTSAQVPVFNVASPVISRHNGDQLPLFVYEL
jgi:Icc-related predicted phosphoesterase